MVNPRKMLSIMVVLACLAGAARAQDPAAQQPAAQPGDGQRVRMMMRGTAGTIASIEGDTIRLKTFDGKDATVKLNEKTVFRKDQKEAKAADFKAGDVVLVRGEQNSDGSWAAQNVTSRSDIPQIPGGPGAGQGSRMMVMGGPGGDLGAGLQQMFEQGWAKQFVMGRVKSIEGTKVAIEGPMDKTATIEVDENTSFRKAGTAAQAENITFPDIKTGMTVFGCGAPNKDGVFVPTTLTISEQGGGLVAAFAGCQNLRPQQK